MPQESLELEPLDVLSLRDRIEKQILDIILEGKFKPGDRLVESAIADGLGVSRAPVREALSALEREGIVINIPRRGHFVMEFTDKDIEEIYSLRLILERGALERAIDRMTEEDVAAMQQVVDRIGDAIRQGRDPRTMVMYDLSFHDLICRTADHSRLYSAWNSMRLQTYLLIGVTSTTRFDYPDQPKEFHQRILDAIVDRDLERADAYLTEHIRDAQRRARTALETLKASDAS